jgi:hypothetical protein
MIILREVVHLQPVFNLISQSQIMNKDAEVEPVNHCCLNLYKFHCELIATAPQVNELFILDCILNRAPELTEYTKIDDRCLLALTNTGYAARHDTMKRLLSHHRLAHVRIKKLEILPTITDAARMTGKCDGESCVKCKIVRTRLTRTTSRATEPLQLVH